ncbi:MAG: DUF294 nucleotidyltransferase-like domain-containing protein [Chromatiales bacterium]|nr:DUF294 nucleotidyltransferase-like domain-containing protein [Chromatiales bacterium]MDX9766829.1 DUF294 nucleotidyltransferase-like domain-containing protein [Ectothiorhodospiraceae bacterium]
MEPAHLEYLAKRLRLSFYARDEKITDPGNGPASKFFIIKQGRVRGETPSEDEQVSGNAWELVPGECFPIGALLARRPVRTIHRAAEDTFCFELDRDDFDKLLKLSTAFNDFCTRRLASLLDQVHRQVQASAATNMGGDTSLNIRLADRIRRAPVTCRPESPLAEVLRIMDAERIGSMVITDEDQRPLGVFTLHDLLSRVALPGLPLDTPVSQVMTPNPLSLPPTAYAFEAAMLMASRGFGHVCVAERGRLHGVISERDLFSLQRVGLVSLSRAINKASDIGALIKLGGDVHQLIGQMIAQGVSVAQISQIITLLNDHVARRVIELCQAELGTPPFAYTWIAFGSEGRQEQTLKTDQDNGILFETPPNMSNGEVRAVLLPLARRINEALAECGYPLCTGNIMASNPECCLSFEEWQARFARWIDQGTPEHLLNASIFFDFRTIEGPEQAVERLRRWFTDKVKGTPRFLRMMAQNSLRNRPPLGLVRDFVVSGSADHPNSIDLKLHGLTPFVDGARILALAHGITATNTLERFRGLGKLGVVPRHESEAWCDAYVYIQLLRMRHHREQQQAGEETDNFVDPDKLNDLDRRILKESFRQARKIQSRIELDYQL